MIGKKIDDEMKSDLKMKQQQSQMHEREMFMAEDLELDEDTLHHINLALNECDVDESCDLDKVEDHLDDHGFGYGFFNRTRL